MEFRNIPSPPATSPNSSFNTPGISEYQEFSSLTPEPIIHPIYDTTTGTFQYIVNDPSSLATVIIDPVLDFDPCTSSISTKSADALLSHIRDHSYKVEYILETHAHADHLSAASYLQARLSISGTRPQVGIGRRIDQVQALFGRRYGVPPKEYEVVFDKLFEDDEVVQVGGMAVKAIHLPGHTRDHLGYQIDAHVFCGDSLFHPSIGTARTDFPGGSADDLWASAQKLLALPDETKIWVGHDYPAHGREPSPFMTVGQHKVDNQHIGLGVQREEFVRMRTERDGALGAPRLLHQSLQINIRGGRLPKAGESGRRTLSVPLKMDAVEGW
ncbi:hypothetical protein E8E11_010599 [Didymella keratinophila]|nr:hypothetical protein E8E11_010599 [Didymella keratinophila]